MNRSCEEDRRIRRRAPLGREGIVTESPGEVRVRNRQDLQLVLWESSPSDRRSEDESDESSPAWEAQNRIEAIDEYHWDRGSRKNVGKKGKGKLSIISDAMEMSQREITTIHQEGMRS